MSVTIHVHYTVFQTPLTVPILGSSGYADMPSLLLHRRLVTRPSSLTPSGGANCFIKRKLQIG